MQTIHIENLVDHGLGIPELIPKDLLRITALVTDKI